MNPMRFRIVPATENGRPGYRVHYEDAKNGKTILWSQVYLRLADAEYAILLDQRYAAGAPVDRSLIGRAA